MLTPRGATVALAGLAMWLAARVVGSPGLEVVGLGLLALVAGALLRSRLGRPALTVRRRLSAAHVEPGTRVGVELEVTNVGATRLPLLLLEDVVPAGLGRGARLGLVDVRPRRPTRVGYTLLPQARGRYPIGPVRSDLVDPFGLTRRRVAVPVVDHLVVTPEVEHLPGATPEPTVTMSFGRARARHLLRGSHEYSGMRPYQIGDDLRRIHWRSVARTGELMIRQEEATRRASAVLFLDDRRSALGQARTPGFERAVSVVASLGVLLAREGFRLRYATPELAATMVGANDLLELLAGATDSRARSITPRLTSLRQRGAADAALVFVAAPPPPSELAAILRAGSGFGARLAVLVHPVEPAALPPDRMAQVEGRAAQARLAFTRAGWDCIVLTPSTRLSQRWHAPHPVLLASNA